MCLDYLFFVFCAFNLDNAIVPKEEIQSGGVPPKDGIPAILSPRFIGPEQADFLKSDDQVIGAAIDNKAKAYPIKILLRRVNFFISV